MCASTTERPPIDAVADLQSVLADRLRSVVARVRLPIDDRCRSLLGQVIDHGIAQCTTDADAMTAEDHLRVLLDDMTQQARILRFDALHEPNLVSALERLCPLRPYC